MMEVFQVSLWLLYEAHAAGGQGQKQRDCLDDRDKSNPVGIKEAVTTGCIPKSREIILRII